MGTYFNDDHFDSPIAISPNCDSITFYGPEDRFAFGTYMFAKANHSGGDAPDVYIGSHTSNYNNTLLSIDGPNEVLSIGGWSNESGTNSIVHRTVRFDNGIDTTTGRISFQGIDMPIGVVLKEGWLSKNVYTY